MDQVLKILVEIDGKARRHSDLFASQAEMVVY